MYAGAGAFSQTATFDGATKVHADSLPAMPSWDTAASRKVEVIEEATPESHEMDRLRTNASPVPRSDTTSPLARPIPMQGRAGSPYGSRTDLPSPGYGGATAGAAQPGYGDDRYGGSNPYGRPPRSPGPGGPSAPNDRYGAGASPYGGSAPYGGNAHESANPYGGSNAYGGNSGGGNSGGGNSGGGNSGGYGNSSGYGASAGPYGSNQSPYGGNSNAGSNAYGGSSNSYGNNNRYGGNASSSPYGQYNNPRPAGNGWRDI